MASELPRKRSTVLVRLMAGQRPKPTREGQEFIVTMYESWEDAAAKARAETKAEGVLTVLRVRGIAVPAAVRKRILAEKNLRQLGAGSRRRSSPNRSKR